jgi:hypothetical protein
MTIDRAILGWLAKQAAETAARAESRRVPVPAGHPAPAGTAKRPGQNVISPHRLGRRVPPKPMDWRIVS